MGVVTVFEVMTPSTMREQRRDKIMNIKLMQGNANRANTNRMTKYSSQKLFAGRPSIYQGA